jgi:hypothetical protein
MPTNLFAGCPVLFVATSGEAETGNGSLVPSHRITRIAHTTADSTDRPAKRTGTTFPGGDEA